MRCRKVRRRLSAFLDGEFGEREKGRIAAHLKACPACGEEVKSLSSLSVLLKEEKESINPSPYFWGKLEQEIGLIEESKSAWGQLWESLNKAFVPAGAAAVLIFGLFIGIQLGQVVYSQVADILGPQDASLVQQEFDQSLHLNTLDDFPRESIGEIYKALLAENDLSD